MFKSREVAAASNKFSFEIKASATRIVVNTMAMAWRSTLRLLARHLSRSYRRQNCPLRVHIGRQFSVNGKFRVGQELSEVVTISALGS